VKSVTRIYLILRRIRLIAPGVRQRREREQWAMSTSVGRFKLGCGVPTYRSMNALPEVMLAAAASSLLTLTLCGWWYGRRIKKHKLHIARLRGEREQSERELADAHHKIGALQRSLAVIPRAAPAKPVEATAPAVASAIAVNPATVSKAPSRHSYFDIPLADVSEGFLATPHGFADTQPFQPGEYDWTETAILSGPSNSARASA